MSRMIDPVISDTARHYAEIDKRHQLDVIALVDEETLRLNQEERSKLVREIMYDSALYEKLEAALIEADPIKSSVEIQDLMMETARLVASRAVSDPYSYFWRQED